VVLIRGLWKLLPGGTFAGAFQTPQAEYLCGTYEGQWVALREGSTCEALPDDATAGRIAAIGLCQHPSAQSVLVVGSGLGLCRQFLRLPQISSVTWAHPDPGYAGRVGAFIPANLRITDNRFQQLSGDIRRQLAQESASYDVVVLNLPDATNSVLNRYYTVEFYEQIRKALQPKGVLAVRVTAGENIMGTELINLGASIRLTLREVFAGLVLAPGEETWFTASDSATLSSDPAVLRDRFASIEEAEAVFSPDALLSVYLPDRAATALENYARADLPRTLLINRDGWRLYPRDGETTTHRGWPSAPPVTRRGTPGGGNCAPRCANCWGPGLNRQISPHTSSRPSTRAITGAKRSSCPATPTSRSLASCSAPRGVTVPVRRSWPCTAIVTAKARSSG